MPDPTEAIDAQLDAYNARDLERFVGCHAPDVVITNAAGVVLAAGHDGMRTMYGPLFDSSPELTATIANRIAVGSFVADHEQIQGFNLPGYPIALQAIAVYEVTDGAISKVRLFF
jgi:hypothetical protein